MAKKDQATMTAEENAEISTLPMEQQQEQAEANKSRVAKVFTAARTIAEQFGLKGTVPVAIHGVLAANVGSPAGEYLKANKKANVFNVFDAAFRKSYENREADAKALADEYLRQMEAANILRFQSAGILLPRGGNPLTMFSLAIGVKANNSQQAIAARDMAPTDAEMEEYLPKKK